MPSVAEHPSDHRLVPLSTPELQATVLLPPPGAPARHLQVAVWHADGDLSGLGPRVEPEPVDVVLPTARSVRRRSVRAAVYPLAAVLDELVDRAGDASPSPSMAAVGSAVAFSLGLVARGRLLPSITSAGLDTWRLGPLDPDDHAWAAQWCAAVPPVVHATPMPVTRPVRIASPEAVLAAIGDAVADSMVRTAAAPMWGRAFAESEPVDVSAAAEWLVGAGAGGEHEASVALRLQPPGDADLDGGLDGCLAVLQVRSVVDPSLVVDAAELWDAAPVVLARFGSDVETAVLLALRRGARVWPPLGRLLEQARPEMVELDDLEASDLLGSVVDDLAAAGITVLWPQDLIRPLSLSASVTETPDDAGGSAMFTMDQLLEVHVTATLDGQVLTEAELEALAEAKRSVVRLRGQWVQVDAEVLAQLRRRREVTAASALGLALGGTIEVAGQTVEVRVDGALGRLTERLANVADSPRELEPAGLEATLRPYQRRGVAWLAEMTELGLGGILADDMGLGKTVQLLGLHLHRLAERPSTGPTLVVCPVTLMANWEREAERFAPDIDVHRFHGTDRSLDDVGPGDLVLTTYGVVRRDAETLAGVDWGLVVADEAQAVKNPLARTARRLRTIGAPARVALTGTPVENRLSELWALLDWTTPGLLGPLERFRSEVAVPVERHRDPEATEALARLVRPFVLRRRKVDPGVADDLPPKTETDQMVLLTTEQATLYRALTAEVLAAIEAKGDDSAMARRGLIFKLLGGLKQICDHPALYLGQDGPLRGRSGKLAATLDLLDVVVEEGEAALVFTQYVGMGKLLERSLREAGRRVEFLHGRVPVRRRQEMVDAFQARQLDVLVVSIKAGGTGLNLTAATHVVHYDRWWNPAVEDQASDRAWRIGQDRAVQVHRMVCEGTLEERIAQMLESKRALAEAVVGAGEGWITELDDAELRALVSLSGADGDEAR
ncbi:MAG: DEAD/DEAH box helicase [Acidimicrobiia bacterium]|nr:DEAD/DEAH box helicase [Acidimicrobiia bacterium]